MTTLGTPKELSVEDLEALGDQQLSRLGHYGLVTVIAAGLCSTDAAPIGVPLLLYATVRGLVVGGRWLHTVSTMRTTVRAGITTCPCSCHLNPTEGATP